jgi:hypothetical protein
VVRPSARAKPFVHARKVVPAAFARKRASASTTFRADEIEAMRVIFNAVRLGDRDAAKRYADTEEGVRANRKVLAMSDRIRGRTP